MPYVPPSYEELYRATSKLQEIFHKDAHHYSLPVYELLCETISGTKAANGVDLVDGMESIYQRHVNEKPPLFGGLYKLSADPTRVEEIACITKLVVDLNEKQTLPGSPERNQAHNIILGALIYRQLAIKASYTETYIGKLLSHIIWWDRENASALYKTLVDVLKIGPDNTLDDLSVVTCCSAYRNYLKEQGATINSAYIRNEPDFFSQLESIISNAAEDARVISERIKPLIALQSIAEVLHKTDEEICVGLPKLAAILSKKLATKESLSRDDMIACMPPITVLSERVTTFISYLLHDEMVVNKENIDKFVSILRDRLAGNSQYILLGAYAIGLNDTQTDSDLTRALKKAMGALRPGNAIDDEAKDWALIALGHYLTLPGIRRDFDFKAWHGYEVLEQKVSLQIEALQDKKVQACNDVGVITGTIPS